MMKLYRTVFRRSVLFYLRGMNKKNFYEEIKYTPILTTRAINDAATIAFWLIKAKPKKIKFSNSLSMFSLGVIDRNHNNYNRSWITLEYNKNTFFLKIKYRVTVHKRKNKTQYIKIRIKTNKAKKHLLHRILARGKYSVIIKKENSGIVAKIIFSLPNPLEMKIENKNYIAGVDININKIAVTVVDQSGNYISSKTYTYKQQQEGQTIRDIVKDIIKQFGRKNVFFVIGKPESPKIYRKDYPFSKIIRIFLSRLAREGIPARIVSEAYTSYLARIKETPGNNIHEKAAYYIARRGIGIIEKVKLSKAKKIINHYKRFLKYIRFEL